MRLLKLALPLLITALAQTVATAASLPGTGLTSCYDGTGISTGIELDAGAFPRQDCRYGPDAGNAAGVLYKVGAGNVGFDYSKISYTGVDLGGDASNALAGTLGGTSASDWACTRDNLTGLTWEVKTALSSTLHDKVNTYTWFDDVNTSTNGGNIGDSGGGTCYGGSGCTTKAFIADVNSTSLCGKTDWHLPSIRELETLISFNAAAAFYIESTYFPNTQPTDVYLSATSYADTASNATSVWVSKANGASTTQLKAGYPSQVRLVSGTF